MLICLIVFCFINSFGFICFSIGVFSKSWIIMDIGRFCMGLGGESFKVATYVMFPLWFPRSELAFVTAISFLSRFGDVFVNVLSPRLAAQYSISVSLVPGIIFCVFSMLSVVFLYFFTKHFEAFELSNSAVSSRNSENGFELVSLESHHEKLTEQEVFDEESEVVNTLHDRGVSSDYEEVREEEATDDFSRSDNAADSVKGEEEPVSLYSGFFQFFRESPYSFWLTLITCCMAYSCMLPFNNIVSSILLERSYFRSIPSSCQLTDPYQCQSSMNPPLSPPDCPSSVDFQLPIPLNYSSYSPLTISNIHCTESEWKDGCTKDFCGRLNHAIQRISFVMSIPFLVFGFLTLPLGKLIDLCGFIHLELLLLSSIGYVITHILLTFTMVDPIVCMIFQGISNCLFLSTYWALLPMIIHDEIYGKAYGFSISALNVFGVIMPIILAQVYVDSHRRYLPHVEVTFVVCAIIGGLPFFYLLYEKWILKKAIILTTFSKKS